MLLDETLEYDLSKFDIGEISHVIYYFCAVCVVFVFIYIYVFIRLS